MKDEEAKKLAAALEAQRRMKVGITGLETGRALTAALKAMYKGVSAEAEALMDQIIVAADLLKEELEIVMARMQLGNVELEDPSYIDEALTRMEDAVEKYRAWKESGGPAGPAEPTPGGSVAKPGSGPAHEKGETDDG